jgi:hypothetical protein
MQNAHDSSHEYLHYASPLLKVLLCRFDWNFVVGAVTGIQGTVMRAALADIIPATKRGLAYGIFNTAYDESWFTGSGKGISYVILFIISEMISIPILFGLIRQVRKGM